MTITLDKFMADRGHPYMTPEQRAAAEAEWARLEKRIANGGCQTPPTVEVRPAQTNRAPYDVGSHSCDAHIAGFLGVLEGDIATSHYEVRHLNPIDDGEGNWCCHVDPPSSPAAAAQSPQIDVLAAMIERFDSEGEWPLFRDGLLGTVRDLVRERVARRG